MNDIRHRARRFAARSASVPAPVRERYGFAHSAHRHVRMDFDEDEAAEGFVEASPAKVTPQRQLEGKGVDSGDSHTAPAPAGHAVSYAGSDKRSLERQSRDLEAS